MSATCYIDTDTSWESHVLHYADTLSVLITLSQQ